MRRRLIVVVALLATGCAPSAAVDRTREVIADLVAREYGAATSRYRNYEQDVLAPAAAPIWRGALDHADATVREWAVDALSRIADPDDVTPIRLRLDDSSRGVRTAAVDGIIRMDPAAASEEFESRIGSQEPEQVTLAASGLAALGRRSATDLVIARFDDTALPDATRAALTQPLAILGGTAVVRALVKAALEPANGTELRRLAAEGALAADADLDAVEVQLRRLLDADDDYIRALAIARFAA